MSPANLHFPAIHAQKAAPLLCGCGLSLPSTRAGLCLSSSFTISKCSAKVQAEQLRPAHATLAYSCHDGFFSSCASVLAIRTPFSVPLCLGKGTQQLFHWEVTTKH